MARVLVTEEIAEDGLQRLRDAGHEVDVRLDPPRTDGHQPAEVHRVEYSVAANTQKC